MNETELGAAIAEWLQLPKNREASKQFGEPVYNTSIGTKTAKGLGAYMIRIIEENTPAPAPARIIAVIRGGVLQDVYSTVKDAEVVLVDHDNGDSDDECKAENEKILAEVEEQTEAGLLKAIF